MISESKKTLVGELPFDQFSRQEIVSYLIDESFNSRNKESKLKIIDLGGHLGKTADFRPKDKVLVLDVFDESYPNYVKGDATNTDYEDDSFDIACSFDVLEHIPRDKRQAFIDEALRISKLGVFIAVPVDIDSKVSSAEVLLNDFYVNICQKDHKWLKEHIDYKIPDEKEINSLISKSGASFASISSNQIGDWQLMQMLLFASSVIPDIANEVSSINSWYNINTISLDANIDIGYRKIIFISKSANNVDSVKRSIARMDKERENKPKVTINNDTFNEFSNTLSLIFKKYLNTCEQNKYIERTKKELAEEVIYLRKMNEANQNSILNLSSDINSIYNSKSWIITKPLRLLTKYFSKLIGD